MLTPEETSARDAKRLEVKARKIAAAEARFVAEYDPVKWQRQAERDRESLNA